MVIPLQKEALSVITRVSMGPSFGPHAHTGPWTFPEENGATCVWEIYADTKASFAIHSNLLAQDHDGHHRRETGWIKGCQYTPKLAKQADIEEKRSSSSGGKLSSGVGLTKGSGEGQWGALIWLLFANTSSSFFYAGQLKTRATAIVTWAGLTAVPS